MSKILLIDNYDSFTHNIVQGFRILGADVHVFYNDQEIPNILPDALVISPGPDHPLNAGSSISLIQQYHGKRPILGVCLGHQAIACAFGGIVSHATEAIHGEPSWINHAQAGLFNGLPTPFCVGRYHSLAIHKLPSGFLADAHTSDGTIMSIRHESHPTFGVQFHPESILTPMGMHIFANFLSMIAQ